ncbi:MAG: YraN family protein [Solirubrobacterales bacterium]|nr:YraN family protein [Solirubrobacterales bacterium]
MSTDLRRTLGAAGEQLAAGHLERLGHTILARNHRTRFGELDLVSYVGDTLVFTEVKTRRASRTGSPWDALHERKRAQVRRMAAAYLHDVTDRPRTREIRFDAIGIVVDGQGRLARLDHLEAAF